MGKLNNLLYASALSAFLLGNGCAMEEVRGIDPIGQIQERMDSPIVEPGPTVHLANSSVIDSKFDMEDKTNFDYSNHLSTELEDLTRRIDGSIAEISREYDIIGTKARGMTASFQRVLLKEINEFGARTKKEADDLGQYAEGLDEEIEERLTRISELKEHAMQNWEDNYLEAVANVESKMESLNEMRDSTPSSEKEFFESLREYVKDSVRELGEINASAAANKKDLENLAERLIPQETREEILRFENDYGVKIGEIRNTLSKLPYAEAQFKEVCDLASTIMKTLKTPLSNLSIQGVEEGIDASGIAQEIRQSSEVEMANLVLEYLPGNRKLEELKEGVKQSLKELYESTVVPRNRMEEITFKRRETRSNLSIRVGTLSQDVASARQSIETMHSEIAQDIYDLDVAVSYPAEISRSLDSLRAGRAFEVSGDSWEAVREAVYKNLSQDFAEELKEVLPGILSADSFEEIIRKDLGEYVETSVSYYQKRGLAPSSLESFEVLSTEKWDKLSTVQTIFEANRKVYFKGRRELVVVASQNPREALYTAVREQMLNPLTVGSLSQYDSSLEEVVDLYLIPKIEEDLGDDWEDKRRNVDFVVRKRDY